MPIIRPAEKKQALLAYKEKLLNDIKYYEKRIKEDLSFIAVKHADFEESSESEDELPFLNDFAPTVSQLKSQQKMLQTDLHATQELASLMVLQSRVDIMVNEPVLKGEPPVTTEGLWREVNADGRIDSVPFSITFYVHQPSSTFGAKSYRSLRVLPIKPAQEAELKKSVLARVETPSDAVEVLRSYSVAYRSRRTTLVKLADKFAQNLHMEPMPEGGCLLKCANLLEISWVLENKWSSVAQFYHKMIFDLENMDECYIKIIRHAHKQLGDPSTDTNERTLILSKIITTCLEAQRPQEPYESMESDTESVQRIEKRRLTIENEASEPKKMRNDHKNGRMDNGDAGDDINDMNHAKDRDNDNEIMAPPKSLPKKVKPKGKENTDQNQKPVKRAANNIQTSSNVKKAKTDNNDTNNIRQREVDKNKNVDDKAESEQPSKSNKNDKNKNKVDQSKNNPEKSTKEAEKTQSTKVVQASRNKEESNTENVKSKEKVTKNHNIKDAVTKNNEKVPVKDTQKAKSTKSKNPEEKPNSKEKVITQKENVNSAEIVKVQEKPKKKTNKDKETQKAGSDNKIVNPKTVSETIKATTDQILTSTKKNANIKNKDLNPKSSGKEKNIASSKNEGKTNHSDKNKASNNDKVVASSENDAISKELGKMNEPNKQDESISHKNLQITTKKNNNNAKGVELDEVPIMSVNFNNAPKKDKIDKIAKQQQSKSSNINKKISNKNFKVVKNTNTDNVEANIDKKATVKKSNDQIVKKTINKDSKSHTDDTASKGDKPLHKIIAKKSEAQLIKASIPTEKPQSKEKIRKNDNKNDTQKANPTTQKDKNTAHKEKVTQHPDKIKNREITTKNKSNENETEITKTQPNNVVITEQIEKNSAKVTTEKMAKNNSTKNKEHIANINKTSEKTKMNATKKVGDFNFAKIKNVKTNFVGKKTVDNEIGTIFSKIPMKLTIHESLKKKNPLRASPRRLQSAFKCPSESNMRQKSCFTNIPRLLKKPELKMSK